MASATIVSGDEVLRRRLEDPTFRREWDRSAFARAMALRVVTYRADNNVSQAALGRLLHMAQPGVARLESGEHTPTLETLQRLSSVLGTGFTVEVGPRGSLELREKTEGERPGRSARGARKASADTPRLVITCDLENGDVIATESLSFSYEGKTYRLDLCRKHLEEVKGALEGFAAAGHSSRRAPRGRRHSTISGRVLGASGISVAARGESQAEIREWARAQGYAVGDRGRIPGEVVAAYESAQPEGGRRRRRTFTVGSAQR